MIKQNRFFIKIFSGYLITIIVLSSLILFISFRNIKSHYIETLTGNLENLNHSIANQIISSVNAGVIDNLDAVVKDLGEKINTRITVINVKGAVLADSENNPGQMENHGYRAEVREALAGKTGRNIRFSKTMQQTMLYVATPIEKNGNIIAVLRTSLYLSDVDSLLNTLRIRIINITLIVILFVLIGVLTYSNNLNLPVKELVAASRKIADGDFNTKVILKRKGDFKKLAETFNMMTRKLKDSFEEISLQRDQLRTIISSVHSGLFVIDKDDKVILYNDSFKNISKTEEIAKKHYWEVLRDPDLLNLIKNVRQSGNDTTGEINIGSKTYLCSVSHIPANEEIVIVFHDISEIMRLQQLKKDFVVNVSHELRTPLTAIKGFVETLEDDFIPGNKRYLEIIERHTDRLINIVNDLLLLAEIEDKSQLQIEEVNIAQMQTDLTKLFAEKISTKKLQLEWEIADELSIISCDPFKLEQVFINLLDNAIKYTDKGKIKIRFSQISNNTLIEIEDTGIGIPEEHLSRIFERFYTVDKSRSRRLGGTGLGLSIAKHIVLLHNGRIDVESTPGTGTTFSILLPGDKA
ncbi:cell wall metabolism sensor histidine kinase WalK [bacterium]|nr:cell wall metabolism sensor histidine kinase WalK [bacterium]MBU1635092.1 cell wall metabolism sensor histidine kinase WalK [bacterium]